MVLMMSLATSAVALAVARMSWTELSREEDAFVAVAPAAEAALSLVARYDRPDRAWNQLLLKSKKQRSDQLHDVMKRMSSKKEQ